METKNTGARRPRHIPCFSTCAAPILPLFLICALAVPALAQSVNQDNGSTADSASETKSSTEPAEENFNIFGQATVISQMHGRFRSPYSGPNSFPSINETRTSMTGTLNLGVRVWDGGELYFDPEISGGFGVGNVFGLGAYTNGDVDRLGVPQPLPYIARLYFSQTIGFGGDQEKVTSGPNALAGSRDVSRVTFTIGRMSAEDFFDGNAYSHDPRIQFMNWALMYDAAWDFPADARGYTYGGVLDFNREAWALRYGVFAEPAVANGLPIDAHFGEAHGQVIELEERFRVCDQPGKARFLLYWNRAHMGNYEEATDDPAFGLDITRTRRYSSKIGCGLNLEQQINADLGGFLRLGWSDGRNEAWAFTECDSTVSGGFVLKGTPWNRKDDTCGTGLVVDGLSGPHRDYLAAGGLGFALGDGRLNYAPEIVWETYYSLKFKNHQIWLTPDLQFIGDPGYNADRGPLLVAGLRLHGEF